jgi:hypothetical protein
MIFFWGLGDGGWDFLCVPIVFPNFPMCSPYYPLFHISLGPFYTRAWKPIIKIENLWLEEK